MYQILPAESAEIEHLHRQYISNIVYSVAQGAFTDWIDKKMKERTQKLEQERALQIKMDPEIYAIFKESNSISGK